MRNPKVKIETGPVTDPKALRAFALAFGMFLGLTIIKFGNPIIMDQLVDMPNGGYQWVFMTWPVKVGYWLLAPLAVWGLCLARWPVKAKWVVWLPLGWWLWQIITVATTESKFLSSATCANFGACVVCYYLGLVTVGRMKQTGIFWLGLALGFIFCLFTGLQQHFGGLEETRRYWMLYSYSTLEQIPASMLKKMQSNRIFGTLFYPNALAGVILIVLPILLAVIASLKQSFTLGARLLLAGLVSVGALGALYWSGSKGGWLIMLGIGLVAMAQSDWNKRFKLAVIGAVLVVGLAGFFVKYAVFFKKGATSVVARFDYWQAAGKTFLAHPVTGSGPGTFGIAYARIKRPESEMAHLAHNDYLQQASDSGLVGAILFAGFVVGTVVLAGKRGNWSQNRIRQGVWLGLLGWAIQEFFEFGLYIPAIGWVVFALMGWLTNQIDTNEPVS